MPIWYCHAAKHDLAKELSWVLSWRIYHSLPASSISPYKSLHPLNYLVNIWRASEWITETGRKLFIPWTSLSLVPLSRYPSTWDIFGRLLLECQEAAKKAAQDVTKGWWQRWNTRSAECTDRASTIIRFEARLKYGMITQLKIVKLGVSQGIEGERDGTSLFILSQFSIHWCKNTEGDTL